MLKSKKYDVKQNEEFVDVKDIKEEVIKCVGKPEYLAPIISRDGKSKKTSNDV